MMYTVCAYYDKETEKFNPPFFMPFVIDDVIESVIDGVKKGKIEGAQAFDLYHLGNYDTATALFNLNQEPKKVIELDQYVKQ